MNFSEHPAARPEPPLNEAEAADFLGISASSLRKSRSNKLKTRRIDPPPYVKLGRRIVYLLPDLEQYLRAHRAAAQ